MFHQTVLLTLCMLPESVYVEGVCHHMVYIYSIYTYTLHVYGKPVGGPLLMCFMFSNLHGASAMSLTQLSSNLHACALTDN